jgi:2-isopropylmalate synthase
MRVHVLDTTLSELALSLNTRIAPGDRPRVLRQLDELGPDFLEVDPQAYISLGGYEPREARLSVLVRRIEDLPAHAGVVSFAADFIPAHQEPMVEQVRRLVSEGRVVVLIAQNFFDAFSSNAHHALDGLCAAREAGATALILDDTRGGTLTSRLAAVCRGARQRLDAPLGIRARNDCGLAVANTLAAVECGFTWVAGAINGYGERCGSADLCSVLPDLELKMGLETVGREKLKRLWAVSHALAEAANQPLPENTPFTGSLAFGHALPASASAVLDSLASVPQVDPEAVGRVAAAPPADASDPTTSSWLEDEGFELELADGSQELQRRQAQQPDFRGFEVLSWEVSTRCSASGPSQSAANATVKVRDAVYSGSATGDGPINALDLALRGCLMPLYPALGRIRLADYRVRVLQPRRGSAAVGRVLIEWTDGNSTWRTAGLSRNLLEASWEALVDGIRLELLRLVEARELLPEPAVDSSWAV